jgi:hypothetical protein
MVSLYVALVHYPVLNRRGETIASAVTNLDLHDLARTARTYEIPACFMVTPLRDQQVLIRRLLDHWCQGVGKELHPDREEALKRLRIADDLATVKEAILQERGESPVIWATKAKAQPGALTHRQARQQLAGDKRPHLLLFGTGWGLAPEALQEVDAVLEPIPGLGAYNHLSVRCAAAILMDRLLRMD